MSSDISKPCELREVSAAESDIQRLFELLGQRMHGISHQAMPTYDQHKQFVMHHPYRAWFFVIVDAQAVGSIYVLDSNFIGINLLPDYSTFLESAVTQLIQHYPPLPAIASVRAGQYQVNVAPEDGAQISALEQMDARLIQKTYLIDT